MNFYATVFSITYGYVNLNNNKKKGVANVEKEKFGVLIKIIRKTIRIYRSNIILNCKF